MGTVRFESGWLAVGTQRAQVLCSGRPQESRFPPLETATARHAFWYDTYPEFPRAPRAWEKGRDSRRQEGDLGPKAAGLTDGTVLSARVSPPGSPTRSSGMSLARSHVSLMPGSKKAT